jgi:prephenate dehydratase
MAVPESRKHKYDAAYQGAPGAFSEEAAARLVGEAAKLIPCTGFKEVFEAVRTGAASAGVLPIENTLAGSIHACYDFLFEYDFKIVAETVLRIAHNLIGVPGASLAEVTAVLSHPVALAQCEAFFRGHPEIAAVPVYDTAGAVERVTREGRFERAAIASLRAAHVYGGTIIERDLQDHPENYTRFLLVRAAEEPQVRATAADWKTTLLFKVHNRPGALHDCLGVFADRRIDLTKIESRPWRGSPFEYIFYVDILGHSDSAEVRDALAELAGRTVSTRLLGSYPLHTNSPQSIGKDEDSG